MREELNVEELFASKVFTLGKMKERLPKSVLDGPILHGTCHYIRSCQGKFSSLIHDLLHFFVSTLWEPLFHLAQGNTLLAKSSSTFNSSRMSLLPFGIL